MRIIGFACNFNNVANGLLENCLRSMACFVDHICIFDDASTEGVKPIYAKYDCTVVFGRHNNFKLELRHKQELLKVALREQPDWIAWWDTDAVVGRHWESRERAELTLSHAASQQIDLLHLPNKNLWRSPFWFRADQSFDDLAHGVYWRNSGELHYRPVAQLHQKQYPQFWYNEDRPIIASKFDQPDGQLLHFGFASEIEIARKYFTYREHGQTGWALDRLVDESTLDLKPALKEWFPEWLLPALGEPGAGPAPFFSPAQMGAIPSFEAWLEAYRGSDRQ